MRILRHAAMLGLLLLGAATAMGPDWKPLEKGLQDAEAKRKYGFISVYTDWCGYCRKLESETLRAQPVVDELRKNFVSIKLNAESEDQVTWKGKKMTKRDLSAAWGVEGFPTMLFLNSKGEIIGSFPSFADADMMLDLLTYISSGARERKVSFEDFLKKRPS
ncbi:MAG TPA: thioredoxin fold domain-containing protein [Fibrobacteria bacterium]|nr:thioredoxin fold domain-containing protein [Fibrobacteria bacterium]